VEWKLTNKWTLKIRVGRGTVPLHYQINKKLINISSYRKMHVYMLTFHTYTSNSQEVYCTGHDQYEYSMVTSFLEGFCGLHQTFQELPKLPRQIHHQLAIHNHPLTLVGAFAINIYITHKSVLLIYINLCAHGTSKQSISFPLISYWQYIVIFLPLSANFHILHIRLKEPV